MTDTPDYTPPKVWSWTKPNGGRRGHVMVELSMMKKDDPAMFKDLPVIYHDKSLGRPRGAIRRDQRLGSTLRLRRSTPR